MDFETSLFFYSDEKLDDTKLEFKDSFVYFKKRIIKCNPIELESNMEFELIISSNTYEDAFFIADLINCSFMLVESVQTIPREYLRGNLLHSFIKHTDINTLSSFYFGGNGLLIAARIAYSAFGDIRKENAIFKYGMARDLIDIHPMDFEPITDFSNYICFRSEQLKYGYVIITCYSILEELNLEIISTNSTPSVIEGKWNTKVLENLQSRFLNNSIDPYKKIPWLVRNNIQRPFKSQIIKSDELCEWSNGCEVKDFYITYCDAILELSFIRDKKASHGVGNRIGDLTIFDVENAYSLIRLILFDFFKIHMD